MIFSYALQSIKEVDNFKKKRCFVPIQPNANPVKTTKNLLNITK